MGKAPIPLTIGVEGLSMDHPILVKLAAQGHTLIALGPLLATHHMDLVIGPKCWRTLPDLEYLDVTIGQARKLKREAGDVGVE